MKNENQSPSVSVCVTTSFGGLAAHGINARYRKSQDGITITRSSPDLVIAGVGLFGLAAGPLYVLGVDQVRLAIEGDFGGDRLYLVIFEILVLIVIGLFIKSNILSRPVAKVSKLDRSISYTHPGYDKLRITADDIAHICVTECRGVSSSPGEGQRIHHAVTVLGTDGNATNIATHVNVLRMTELANELAAVLSVTIKEFKKNGHQ